MLQDTFATLFWFSAGALPFFTVQLLLCFKVKNSIIRKIPLFVLILGALFAADMYFNFSGIHHGWHELGAFLIAVYVFMFSAGDVAAWLVYCIYRKKQEKSETDKN